MIENVKYDFAYSEVYEILNFLGNPFINKLPPKMFQEIKNKRKKEYTPNIISKDGKIDESRISKTAVAIFAFLNFQFFIDDEEEKSRLVKIWRCNET